MSEEAGRHRKAIAAATSSGSAMRPIGVRCSTNSFVRGIDLHAGCANAADEVESGTYRNSSLRAHDPDVSQDYFRSCLEFALSLLRHGDLCSTSFLTGTPLILRIQRDL
jgi:hypothetical protein